MLCPTHQNAFLFSLLSRNTEDRRQIGHKIFLNCGLGTVARCTRFERSDRNFFATTAGDQDHWNDGNASGDHLDQFQTIHLRHLKVSDNRIWIILFDFLEGLATGFCEVNRPLVILFQDSTNQSSVYR